MALSFHTVAGQAVDKGGVFYDCPWLILKIWVQVFKNGSRKICGRQPLINFKGYGLPKADHMPSNFLKVVFHKFYLVHSWILCLKYL